MSMDELYKQMLMFARSLETFNTQLQTSWKDLQQKHDALTLLWQNDEFHKAYNAQWEPFRASLERYLRHDAPQYMRFLNEKIKHLGQFLRGGSGATRAFQAPGATASAGGTATSRSTATNLTHLLQKFEDYHASLTKHLALFQAEYQALDQRWRPFGAVFEGNAAQEFHAHWNRTKRMLEAYIQATQGIEKILAERIENLRPLA